MIKLVTLLKEVAKNTPTPEEQRVIDDLLGSLQEGALDDILVKVKRYAKKGLLTTTVLMALAASPEFVSAQTDAGSKAKANAILGTRNMDPSNPADVKRVDTGYMKWTLGTSDDGVLGQYTSQFMMPGTWAWKGDDALAKQGTGTNKKLLQLSQLKVEQMEAWNKFVEWMKKTTIIIPTKEDLKLNRKPTPKPISGHPGLDLDPEIGQEVIDYYRSLPGNGDFWVKGWKEVKQVQQTAMIYRDLTVADWKAGKDDPKGAHPGIIMPK